MRSRIGFEDRLIAKVEIASGDVVTLLSTGTINPRLDSFALHDSLIYKWEIIHPLDGEAHLVIFGLLPTWQDVFELHFSGVGRFTSSNFDLLKPFGIHEVRCKPLVGSFEYEFIGEFENQFFSFVAAMAEYKKFRLDLPLSRQEMGFA